MKIVDIIPDSDTIEESYVTVFGKTGNRVVRKYRCTSGKKKGRIVAKPATCGTPINVKKSKTLSRTKAAKKGIIIPKTKRTKRASPLSARIRKSNKAIGPRSHMRKSFKRF